MINARDIIIIKTFVDERGQVLHAETARPGDDPSAEVQALAFEPGTVLEHRCTLEGTTGRVSRVLGAAFIGYASGADAAAGKIARHAWAPVNRDVVIEL